MILRRLPQHVKDQNWIAVVLDFVIVVAGILIAFQISSMAEKRGEVAQFDRQMEALKVEMTENLDRYEIAVDRIRDQYESITALRELLADPESAATEAEINNLFYKSIGVIGIYTKRNSLDVALSSELFVESNAAELIDQIEQWEEKLAQLNRVQQDALNFSRQHHARPFLRDPRLCFDFRRNRHRGRADCAIQVREFQGRIVTGQGAR